MLLHQRIKESIDKNKKEIELIQWAIIAGISSLIYSAYISKMKHKETPVKVVEVPAIKNVSSLLRDDSNFMKLLSTNLIDHISVHPLITKYLDSSELSMFKEENVEIMKTIYDLYIVPNISRRIPEAITKKFGLDNPEQQYFRENWEIDLFDSTANNGDNFDFIVDQTALQLLMLLPSMKKEVVVPESNFAIHLCDNEILTIANENALCPIHFNETIFDNRAVIDLLFFVTNTNIIDCRNRIIYPMKSNNEPIKFIASTSAFNSATITKFIGIE